MNVRPILGLTMGDPAGIGPEICLRALREPTVLKSCIPVLFGDANLLRRLEMVRLTASTRRIPKTRSCPTLPADVLTPEEFSARSKLSEATIVDCPGLETAKVRPGRISPACGRAAYRYIEHAIQAALVGRVGGVVTAPIHKQALHQAGITHPGHTEIFTSLTRARRTCMMLYSKALTVTMVTTHVGYHEVPGRLSTRRVLDVIELTASAMRRLLRRAPRLGVCGLNPHAGEHGLFGQCEEERCIGPAVARARRKGIHVQGPLVPDAAFTTAQRSKYDAIVTLYHDQGHIPFKMLAFDTGVNITLGLPIVRTSVDHGTAFDIAWQGKADPQSMFSAIGVATRLARGE